MINSVTDYKSFLDDLRVDLISMAKLIPKKDKRNVMLKIAVELGISFMTVDNYLSGLGRNPETSLAIKEKLNEQYGSDTSNF